MVFEGRGAVMNTSLRKLILSVVGQEELNRGLQESSCVVMRFREIAVMLEDARRLEIAVDYLMTSTGTVLSDRTSAA